MTRLSYEDLSGCPAGEQGQPFHRTARPAGERGRPVGQTERPSRGEPGRTFCIPGRLRSTHGPALPRLVHLQRQHLPLPDRREGLRTRGRTGRPRRPRAGHQRRHRLVARRGSRRLARRSPPGRARLRRRPRRAAGRRRTARRGPARRPRRRPPPCPAPDRPGSRAGAAVALVRPGRTCRSRRPRSVLRRPGGLHRGPHDGPGGDAGAAGVREGAAVIPGSPILGCAVRRSVPLGGGAAQVKLTDGRTVVVKEGAGVAAEAAGLRWLAVPKGPPVPAVLGLDGPRLVTEYVPPGRPSATAAAEFGRRLAALHAEGAPAFGTGPPETSVDAWIGRAPMRNVASGPEWAPWYAEHRVAPYLRTARDAGDLTE